MSPKDREVAMGWLKSQREGKEQAQKAGAFVSGGLFLASFVPALRGVAVPLRTLAGVGSGAVVASELPDLMMLDAAAQAGYGGDRLTSQSPEQARFNLVMGYANVALAGMDVGAEVGAVRALARVPGVVSGLSRDRARVLLLSLSRLKGEVSDAIVGKMASVAKGADNFTATTIVNADGTMTQSRPLGQMTDAMDASVAARSSGKVARSVEGFENAAAVKPLIGKKFNLSQLPEDYKYAKIPLEDGTVREVIYLPKSNNKMVPLEIDKDGLVKVGPKGEYRVVRDKYYNANFETIPGQKGTKVFQGKGNSWIHHMVPDNVMRADPLYQRAFELGIFNPDRTSNLIELAGNEKALKAGRELLAKNHPEVKVSDFTHYTQHPKYDEIVRTQISDEIKFLKKQSGLTNLSDDSFIQRMKPEEVNRVIKKIENRMRRGLMNEDPKLHRLIQENTRDNGSLAENPLNSNTDFA